MNALERFWDALDADPDRKALCMFLLVVVAGRLLDGLMSGLTQRVRQRDPVASRLRHEARPQSVGAEIRRVHPPRSGSAS